jgi:hypothetical protein
VGKPTSEGLGEEAFGSEALATLGLVDAVVALQAARNTTIEAAAVSLRKPRRSIRSWRS